MIDSGAALLAAARRALPRALRTSTASWAAAWLADRAARRLEAARDPRSTRVRHLVLAICDHFEPLWGGGELESGRRRVRAWREGYPALARLFRDADGRPPRHTFFFPGEQYAPELVEPLAEMCELGLGEVEMHLHHDGDTRESLAAALRGALDAYESHGLVSSTRGARRWAFIHGNWSLANSRPDGRWCGVDDELDLLHELGCYADLTFPSAPDPCQPAIVNAIYYPEGDVRRRAAFRRGSPVRVGSRRRDRVLLIQGPLALARRPGFRAVRIDAAALTARDPATEGRLRTWLDQHVHVRGRPEWAFIKLHTHGAPEAQAGALLGAPQRRFHEALARLAAREGFSVHYVTAREMFNIARAAMDGASGDPGAYRDHEVPPPPRARVRT